MMDIGNIGYAVRVSEWGKGYGTEQLRRGLEIAERHGIKIDDVICVQNTQERKYMIYRFKQAEPQKLLSGHLNLGGSNPAGERIDVNSAYFTRGEKPWIPVMGEFHFSRCRREEWAAELGKMKAGGITLVSTYLFWIYHEEMEGEFDFSGDNDIRAFVLACKEAGLEVVLRIGPWAHGECRNGGFPDWLVKKPFALREDDPEYLKLVRIWYQRIAEEVKGLFYKDGGNIVAVQLENEYVHNAEHLATLKKLALECGLKAPLYTVTGWNSASGAKIPVDEVVPVFGGYCEAPWENHTEKLVPSPHYFFNRMRNDSAIGADLIAHTAEGSDAWQLPYERYPFATCELGGGIQVTHHRRPIIRPMDIYAVSLIKLGDGNNLPGYYMYHGGTNQLGKLSTFQESRATGYPNDYPVLSYDFQTALSEYGEVREQYRLLNLLHLFIQDFQESFAPLQAVDALETVAREDTVSLRYGMRTDGEKGYVFVNHYQRLTGLADVEGAVIDTGSVVFPPIDVKGEVSFFLPFKMELCSAAGSSRILLEYATVQPLCRMDSTYFFVEIPGIPARYRFADGQETAVQAGKNSLFTVGDVGIVTLTLEEAKYLRRLDGIQNTDGLRSVKGAESAALAEQLKHPALYLGGGCDLYQCEGRLCSVQPGEYTCYLWNGQAFLPFTMGAAAQEPKVTWQELEEAPFEPPYGEELQIGGPRALTWKKLTVEGQQGFVSIEEDYDVAQLYADGQLVADNYYYGMPWRVPAGLLAGKENFLVMSERRDDFYREF